MSQTAFPTANPTTPAPALPTMQQRSANIWQLTLNELYKLHKRRLVWGLLALDLFFVFAAWLVLVFYAIKSKDGFEPGHLLGGIDALSHSIGQPMTLGRRGGEFIAVALGGLAFGGEFSSGAIRLVFSRGVNRASYLLAKYIALAIACLALVIASLLMSAILTNFLLIIHQPAPTLLNLDGRTAIALFGICVGTFENFLLCLLLGAALSIVTRSAAFGIAAGFGYLIGEDIAAQILPVIGKSLHIPLGNQLNNLLFTTNLNAFYANTLPVALARGLDNLDGVIACNLTDKTCVPVSATQSLLVVLLWALVLGGVSTYLFVKRDVLQ
ncbi:MAG TPA: ABC transporter permease [Ktedonobacteraceae bacterium]|nr:ABC transporter permease [Ktedonobacteraceae bacterium]